MLHYASCECQVSPEWLEQLRRRKDELQFKIFGKQWDAINPMIHLQYFNEASLTRLLRDCGFEKLQRMRFPPLPRLLTPKWMQLFRELGGDESGEFAMVAQRPSAESTA